MEQRNNLSVCLGTCVPVADKFFVTQLVKHLTDHVSIYLDIYTDSAVKGLKGWRGHKSSEVNWRGRKKPEKNSHVLFMLVFMSLSSYEHCSGLNPCFIIIN